MKKERQGGPSTGSELAPAATVGLFGPRPIIIDGSLYIAQFSSDHALNLLVRQSRQLQPHFLVFSNTTEQQMLFIILKSISLLEDGRPALSR